MTTLLCVLFAFGVCGGCYLSAWLGFRELSRLDKKLLRLEKETSEMWRRMSAEERLRRQTAERAALEAAQWLEIQNREIKRLQYLEEDLLAFGLRFPRTAFGIRRGQA